MDETRRRLVTAGLGIGLGTSTGFLATASAAPAASSILGLPATTFGIKPDSGQNETMRLVKAIEAASEKNASLLLPAGRYNMEGISLSGKPVNLIGVPDATIITGKEQLLAVTHSPMVRLEGIVFEGAGKQTNNSTPLVSIEAESCTATSCTFQKGGDGLSLKNGSGHVTRCHFRQLNGNGLTVETCYPLFVSETVFRNLQGNAIKAENGSGFVITGNVIEQVFGGIHIRGSGKENGRLAVINGNIITNVNGGEKNEYPGIGIYAEYDTIINGNVIEKAEFAGIRIGWGERQRDINCSGNTIRNCPIGIGVSGDFKAGYAVIALNMISGSASGAIRAMDQNKPLGPDLAHESAESYRTLAIFGNVAPR